ncbi:conjugal transfer protein TrbD, partial [Neisseria gonorrhoeae]
MRAIRTIPIRRVANRPNLFWGGDREMVQVSLLITFVLVVAA